MPRLEDVFGIMNKIPPHTYINRASLDETFTYLLNSDKHIVIYGPSKQGKTVLRRKNIPDNNSVVIQCGADWTVDRIYRVLLGSFGSLSATQVTTEKKTDVEGKLELEGKLPFVAGAKGEGSYKTETATETENKVYSHDHENLSFIASEAKKSGKRIIIEDFHYLSEDEKRKFSFDMKAFWDLGVYFIIIGIWADQNLLTYYNNDLSGRVENIDIHWTTDELNQVLEKGERALNIEFTESIKQQIIGDANNNVGLLQRIAEALCRSYRIFAKENRKRILDSEDLLSECRRTICLAEAPRYNKFCEAVIRGFRNFEESEIRSYEKVLRVCLHAADPELVSGIHKQTIGARLKYMGLEARNSDLTSALRRLNRLQENRAISPIVLSYNENTQKVQLVDREFLFYRRYGDPRWPWQDEDDELDATKA